MAEVIPAGTTVAIPAAGITDLTPAHITAVGIADRITAVITGTAAIMAGVAVTVGTATARGGGIPTPIRITAIPMPTLPIRTLPTLLSITRLLCRANRSNLIGITARIRKVITRTSPTARVDGHRYSRHRPSQERRV